MGVARGAEAASATEEDPPIPVSDAYPRASEATTSGGGVARRCAPPWCGCRRRCTAMATMASCRFPSSRSRASRAPPPISGTGRTAGPVHRLDAARVYRLALERGGRRRAVHAVADEGVPFKAIAEVIARRLDVPRGFSRRRKRPRISAGSHRFAGTLTCRPRAPAPARHRLATAAVGLLADIDHAAYFAG